MRSQEELRRLIEVSCYQYNKDLKIAFNNNFDVWISADMLAEYDTMGEFLWDYCSLSPEEGLTLIKGGYKVIDCCDLAEVCVKDGVFNKDLFLEAADVTNNMPEQAVIEGIKAGITVGKLYDEYLGSYSSIKEYLEDSLGDLYPDIPKRYHRILNLDLIAEDMRISGDYTEANGYLFSS